MAKATVAERNHQIEYMRERILVAESSPKTKQNGSGRSCKMRLFLRDLASFLSMVFCVVALCAAMAAFKW